MDKERLIHKRIIRKEYKDVRLEARTQRREALKKKKAVYKCAYELVMGHEPVKSSTGIDRKGPHYRTQGATMNGQKL